MKEYPHCSQVCIDCGDTFAGMGHLCQDCVDDLYTAQKSYPWPQYYDCPDCGTPTLYDTDCEGCNPRTATQRWQDNINSIISESRGTR